MGYLRLDRVGGRGRRRACVKLGSPGTPITHECPLGLPASASAVLLVPVLGSTLGTPAVLQLGPTDPHPSAPLSAPQAVDVAPVTSSADHHPLPTSPAYVSATGLDGASSRSSGRPSRPPAPSPLDTKRLVASRTGGPALVRPPPNFRTLLQPPKLAGQKVGIKRYSPFWRAIRSSMTAGRRNGHRDRHRGARDQRRR